MAKRVKYECIPCQFSVVKKRDYNRHLLTEKHKRGGMGKPLTLKSYNCSCGHSYKHRSGLSRHKKNCNQDNPIYTTPIIENTQMTESVKDLKIKFLEEKIKDKEDIIKLLKEKYELAA
tara:strand:- start:392 stop:745 length:354 start_codon:yes stop_codon:yes gene_type:complete